MDWESSDVVRFDRGPLLQGQMRIAKLKSASNLLIIGPRGLQCETNIWEIMGWDSSDVVRFDLGAPLSRSIQYSKTSKQAWGEYNFTCTWYLYLITHFQVPALDS